MKNKKIKKPLASSPQTGKKSRTKLDKISSYRDTHSVGRRSSSVITYSENSNLYYDLFTKCGVYNATAFQYYGLPISKQQKTSRESRSSLPLSQKSSQSPKKRIASLNARAIMTACTDSVKPKKVSNTSSVQKQVTSTTSATRKSNKSENNLHNIPLILGGETIYSKLPYKRLLNESNKNTAIKPLSKKPKKSSNIWNWVGEPFEKHVFTSDNHSPVRRKCYSAIEHTTDGMIIKDKENVLICSDNRGLPHIARITALYQDDETHEKKMSLLWYYRPEAIKKTKGAAGTSVNSNNPLPNELYASRHADSASVDCIEDRAYVFPLNVYNRFMANEKHKIERKLQRDTSSPDHMNTSFEEFPDDATENNVFICRGVYDLKAKRVVSNPVHVTYPFGPSSPLKSPLTISSPTTSSQRVELNSTVIEGKNKKTNQNTKSPTVIPSDVYAKYSRKSFVDPNESRVQDLSINWGEHGSNIALSLKSKQSPSVSPKAKPQNRSTQKILVL